MATAARAAVLALLVASATDCSRERRPADPQPLPVEVIADGARTERLHVEPPPRARVWVARVTPAPPGAMDLPPPEAAPDTVFPESPPRLETDPNLKPPILRVPARLEWPAGARARGGPRGAVELDVRVDEAGGVTDAQWAGGNADSALVGAARRCALRMRFHPALLGGRPIAVWCRQRFDFGAR